MKQFLTLTLLLLPFMSGYSQTPEELKAQRYVPCSHEHTDPNEACYVKLPTEEEIRNHSVELRGSSSCRLRPLRVLIPYDRVIEDDYTPAEIDSMILQNASKLDTAFQNSNIEYAGIEYMIMPWDIPDYESIFDVSSMIARDGDGQLDSLKMLKNELLDIDILMVLTRENSQGRGVASQSSSQFFRFSAIRAVVNFNEIVLNSIVFVHECGHTLGAGHEFDIGNGADSNARAYINDSLKTHSAVKAANRLSREVSVFSGPNSWAYTQQGVYHNFYDSIKNTNNAYYVQLIHDEFMCANTVTYVLIDTPLCGSGQLRATTNNADSFIWQVVSGNIELQAKNDTLVDYIAHEESVVRVIGQKTGKLYADTAYMTVPARQQVEIDTMMTRGDMLSDGTIVNQSGTYVVTELDENGCEVIITYNVELTTSVSSFQDEGIRLYPNPVSNQLQIQLPKRFVVVNYSIIDMEGRIIMEGSLNKNTIHTKNLPQGTYILQLIEENNYYQTRFVKQ